MHRYQRVMTAVAAIAGVVAGCTDAIAPVDEDQLVISGGDDQEAVTAFAGHLIIGSGSMPDSLRVQLTDPSGAPLAGRTVTWTTTAGSVSPAVSTTDAEGSASTRWSLYSPSTGWAAVGSYQVHAQVQGVEPVSFTGHARAGVTLESISFTPDTVSVAIDAAPVSMAVKLKDDRRDAALELVTVQLYNPSATSTDFQSLHTALTLTSGNASDSEWTGSFTVPADAEHGAWSFGRIVFSWGCGGERRATLLAATLQQLGLTHQLHVVGPPAGLLAASPARAGSSEFQDATTFSTTC
jgi:hypothetical protein